MHRGSPENIQPSADAKSTSGIRLEEKRLWVGESVGTIKP